MVDGEDGRISYGKYIYSAMFQLSRCTRTTYLP